MKRARHDHRVDDVAAVVDGDVFLHVDRAGLGVDLDDTYVRPKRPHEVGRLEIRDRLEPLLYPCRQLAVGCKRNLAQRLGFVGRAFDMELAMVEHVVLLARPDKMRPNLLALAAALAPGRAACDSTDRKHSPPTP